MEKIKIKIEIGLSRKELSGRIDLVRSREVKIVFEFLIQGNRIQIKDLNISKLNLN
jgi:hypothetical protein